MGGGGWALGQGGTLRRNANQGCGHMGEILYEE